MVLIFGSRLPTAVLAFNRELDRVRAEALADDALVASKKELGVLREGRVVVVVSWRKGKLERNKVFCKRMVLLEDL